MTGLLVEGTTAARATSTATAPAEEVNWYSFPQGPRSSRVYLAHHDVHRYTGTGAAERFLVDLGQCASPNVALAAAGRPSRRIATHPSVDTWTDGRAPGVVLVGDAAGYNDPIIGQGLSLTMADVRDVPAVILAGGRAPRRSPSTARRPRDRHAKQRMAAQTMAELMCSFGDEARRPPPAGAAAPRQRRRPRSLIGALFAGPEVLPPGTAPLEAAR